MTIQDALTQRQGVQAAAGALAAVSTIPYIVLKLAWLTGHDLGLRHHDLMQATTFRTANAITLVLDLLVVLLAVTLASGFRRVRWLVLVLMWCVTGLLVTPAVAAVTALLAAPSTTNRLVDDSLESWVFLVVYAGFGLQALGLVGATPGYVARAHLLVSSTLCLLAGIAVGMFASASMRRRRRGLVLVWFGSGGMVLPAAFSLIVSAAQPGTLAGVETTVATWTAAGGVVVTASCARAGRRHVTGDLGDPSTAAASRTRREGR